MKIPEDGWSYKHRKGVNVKTLLWVFNSVKHESREQDIKFRHTDQDKLQSFLHMQIHFWRFNRLWDQLIKAGYGRANLKNVLVLAGTTLDQKKIMENIRNASALGTNQWLLKAHEKHSQFYIVQSCESLLREHQATIENVHLDCQFYTWRPGAVLSRDRQKISRTEEHPISESLQALLHNIHESHQHLALDIRVYAPWESELIRVQEKFQGRLLFVSVLLKKYKFRFDEFEKTNGREWEFADPTMSHRGLRIAVDASKLKQEVFDVSVKEAELELKVWLKELLSVVEKDGNEALIEELFRVAIRSDLLNEEALFSAEFTLDAVQYGLGLLTKPKNVTDGKFGQAWMSEILLRETVFEHFSKTRHAQWEVSLTKELLTRTDSTASFGKALEYYVAYVSWSRLNIFLPRL